jgi:hypothetical protein
VFRAVVSSTNHFYVARVSDSRHMNPIDTHVRRPMNPHDTNGNNQNGNRPNGYPMYDPAFLFEDETSLKDFIPVLWRGKLIIILIALIVFNLVLVYTLTREPEYEAVVSVYINTKKSTTLYFNRINCGRYQTHRQRA